MVVLLFLEENLTKLFKTISLKTIMKYLFFFLLLLISCTAQPTIDLNLEEIAYGENLALNKEVTSSSDEREKYNKNNLNDNDLNSRWDSVKGEDNAWIYIDLEDNYNISKIVLHWETAYGKQYEIQTSNDAQTWNTVYTEINSDGNQDEILVDGIGRYVRMQGIERGTQYGYSLYEFKIYGDFYNNSNSAIDPQPTPEPVPEPQNPGFYPEYTNPVHFHPGHYLYVFVGTDPARVEKVSMPEFVGVKADYQWKSLEPEFGV